MFDARRPLGGFCFCGRRWWHWRCLLKHFPPRRLAIPYIVLTEPPAGGTLPISWPEFTTAGRGAVAAGNTSVTLGQQARYRSARPERERHPRKYDLLRRVPIG